MEHINVVRTTEEAQLPSRAHTDDGGLDLYSPLEFTIEPGKQVVVSVGVSFGLQPGYVGIVFGRSSLSARGIDTSHGVIDAGYRGDLRVQLRNWGSEPYTFERGDRIAQLLILKVATPEVHEVGQLPTTERGVAGFGSTGR